MFKNQPKGLYALALANTGERFGYYTMLFSCALISVLMPVWRVRFTVHSSVLFILCPLSEVSWPINSDSERW